ADPIWLPSAPSTKGGPHPRVSSPAPLRSTLITSAPRSASTCPAQGPARIRASSRTRRPSNGFGIIGLILRFTARMRRKVWLFVWLGQQNLSRLDIGDEYQ